MLFSNYKNQTQRSALVFLRKQAIRFPSRRFQMLFIPMMSHSLFNKTIFTWTANTNSLDSRTITRIHLSAICLFLLLASSSACFFRFLKIWLEISVEQIKTQFWIHLTLTAVKIVLDLILISLMTTKTTRFHFLSLTKMLFLFRNNRN